MILFLYFRIFHSKSVVILVLCLDLEKYHQNLLSIFKMNNNVNIEDNFFVHF